MNNIRIGNQAVGIKSPCFLVAEIGINHNGNIQLAKDTVDAAVESGADSVKFQNYKTSDFILNKELTFEYVCNGKKIAESQYEMFKRYELDLDMLKELKKYCDDNGVVFHSTPSGIDGVKNLLELNVGLLKNGSDLLSNYDLITAMGNSGLPTIMSTGMAYLSDIDHAVRKFRKTGNNNLILLHCTSCYPTLPEQVNLKNINVLKNTFNCLVGFSDHTIGNVAAVGAVTQGACLIEKHFTLSHNLDGPDHAFSSNPEEFKQLVDSVREIEKCMGVEKLYPVEQELDSRRDYTLSCVVNKDLTANHVLRKEDISYLRPGNGIHPSHSYLIIGRKLKTALNAGEQLTVENLD
jgi:N,N'-diacetyllegionaminate synthase